jgi:2-polyprenyl-6-methoxyphenol hydroxylase-like FAD-dependent oxidoreductase
LLAGQGASLAMAAAYVLSGEMNTKAAVAEALEAYEQRVKPVVQKKQAGGRKMAGWFAPRNSMRIMLRDLVFRLSAWPVVARLARKSLTGDEIALE